MKELTKNSQNQLFRFGSVGIVNTVLDFCLLFIFKSLGLPIALSNILSTTIAFGFSFIANKKYTFKTSGTNIVREMVLFVIVTLFGLWILQNLVIMLSLPALAGLTRSMDLGLLFAKLLATVISMIWNYLLYRSVVFKKS